MEDPLRQQLLTETRQALDADDWDAVVRLWQPWVDQGDAEAEYQLAHHYLWYTGCDDEAACDQMHDLLRHAASQDHPDAIWFLATLELQDRETNPEFERQLLRAGRLGSRHAQRSLGVLFATGTWSGPRDLAEAVRWYRLAAEQGEAESQYDLGFMLLLGEGAPRNLDEGLMWLERAAAQGESDAIGLLAGCYGNGECGVPLDEAKTRFWRRRLEEHQRLDPPEPRRSYRLEGRATRSSLECLWDLEGVTGFVLEDNANTFSLSYAPATITPAALDAAVQALVPTASPAG